MAFRNAAIKRKKRGKQPFEAKYRGHCPCCDRPILVGDQVVFQVVHYQSCPDPEMIRNGETVADLKNAEPVPAVPAWQVAGSVAPF